MPLLKITLLGTPQIELDGEQVVLKTRKALALLVYLVVTQHAHSRETLASIFWPESSADRAFANLRDTLWQLKKALSDDWLDIRRHEVSLKKRPGLWSDVLEFQLQLALSSNHPHASETACDECAPCLLAAVDLYTDDFLRGFTLPDCPAFDGWQASTADGLRGQLINCFRKIIQYAVSQNDFTQAVNIARRWVTICPCSEAAHRELMRTYALNHQRSAALQQYQDCVRMLQEEFGTKPGQEAQALYEAIVHGDSFLAREELSSLLPEREHKSPPWRGKAWVVEPEENSNSTTHPQPLPEREFGGFATKEIPLSPLRNGEKAEIPNNLPAQTTSFIGRETEIAVVSNLLSQPDIRLVTLTGSGGSGKTRLSMLVAGELLGQYADGVFFVSLAPISNPELVIPAIMQTLGLQAAGNASPLNVLTNYVQKKHLLLVLDNFEHVLDAALVLIDLLAVASGLKMLVTSRIVLHLSGEHEYLVPPLNVPDPTYLPSFERLAHSEAVQLFTERAQSIHPNFTLTEETIPIVAEICIRLDGLPLAIELAATRIRIFTPHEICARLEHRLRFLTGGAHDLPVRQRTIRGTIEWSYGLLDNEEKTLFHRLGVFMGGWTLDAAQSVCAINNDVDVLSTLESLLDHNLIVHNENENQSRFSMLETIREYALERLAESGEEDVIRRQHARFFLTLGEEAEQWWYTEEQAAWLTRLDMENNNLRAALAWSLDHDLEIGLRLGGTLEGFWNSRGYSQEGHDWLTKVLVKSRMVETGLKRWQAKALIATCLLAWLQGDLKTACSQGEEGLALWRTVGDPSGLAYALHILGASTTVYGNYHRARILLEEGITLCRENSDQRNLSIALWKYGELLFLEQKNERAHATAEELLSLGQKIGNITAQTGALHILGNIAISQKDYSVAQSHYESGLKLARKLEDSYATAYLLAGLAALLDMQGDYERAGTCYVEGVERLQKRGNDFEAAWQLSGLGRVALHKHDWQTAQAHFETSLNIFQQHESREGVAACIIGLAGVAEGQGHVARVTQLLGAIEQLPEISRGHFLEDLPIKAEYERILTTVRHTSGKEAFESAYAKGREMTLDEAIAYALDTTVSQ